jgi:hypothetical protein
MKDILNYVINQLMHTKSTFKYLYYKIVKIKLRGTILTIL